MEMKAFYLSLKNAFPFKRRIVSNQTGVSQWPIPR